jgi:hypothetical protein
MHPGGKGVGSYHTHRLARLHQKGLVVFQIQKAAHDGVEAVPVAGRLAPAAVDHQFVRLFAVFRIKVVAEHPERGLLVPAFAVQLGAARGLHRARRAGAYLEFPQEALPQAVGHDISPKTHFQV